MMARLAAEGLLVASQPRLRQGRILQWSESQRPTASQDDAETDGYPVGSGSRP